MGVDNFMLTFDNPAGVFYAGQIVTGAVRFLVAEPTNSEGVFVRFSGSAEVHWTESQTTGTGDNRRTEKVHYRAQETYIDMKICLYMPPGNILQPYNYVFPFSFQLPPTLPSSFIGSNGKVHYFVRANVHRPFKFAKKITLPFSVVSIKDLNYIPHLSQPLRIENNKTFGILFWKSKPLKAELTINRSAFVSGENILISGTIDNASDVKIKHCEIILKKHIVYKARGKTRSETKKEYELCQPGLDKESSITWTNVPVFVPCLPPSGLDGCNIIDTHYSLEVRIVPPGVHFALELFFQITIGTVPYRQYYTPPPQAAAQHGYAVNQSLGNNAPGEQPLGTPPYHNESSDPSGISPSAPPQYVPPTSFGDYGSGDASAPPSYNDLFKGADDEDDQDGAAKNYIPKYPSYNISKQPPPY